MSDNNKFVELLLEDRYYRNGEKNWHDLCERVARYLSDVDYEDDAEHTKKYEQYKELMLNKKFLPASPILMSAGTDYFMGASCFVFDIEDTLESIMDTVKIAALVFSKGGGCGYSMSALRPKGAIVSSTGTKALGPEGVIRLIDKLTDEIKQLRRRGANLSALSVDHPDIERFIDLKKVDGTISNFNLSVAITDDFMVKVKAGDQKACKLWDKIIKSSWSCGEPGVLYMGTINNNSPYKELGLKINATNPCTAGSVFVAVADGRNYVSIKQLAEEGKDVLVHCVDPRTGEAHVRMGRNPRKTRKDVDVFKVKFDDGSHIVVTEDHKFLRRNGTEVKTKDLVAGDSLWAFNKRQDVNTTRGKKYWVVSTKCSSVAPGKRNSYKYEHRMILGYDKDKISPKHICHHIDDDSLNNKPANLQWITVADHNRVENARRGGFIGEKNPMWGKHHSESTRRLLSEKATIRFKDADLRRHLSMKQRQNWKNPRYAKRMTEIQRRMNDYLYTSVECYNCGKAMRITKIQLENRRAVNINGVFCSIKCSAQARSINISNDKLLSMGCECIEKTGKLTWDSWRLEYNKYNQTRPGHSIVKRVFGSWVNFVKEVKENYNHKVASVEPAGKQDVYNITVDEFHNLAYITDANAKTHKLGLSKLSGVYTSNCGENPLPNAGNCLLGSINLSNLVDDNGKFQKKEFRSIIKIAYEMLNDVLDHSKFPNIETLEFAIKYRSIGLGIAGFADMLIKMGIVYGDEDSYGMANYIGKTLKDVTDKLKVVYKNTTALTIAPTGSISILMGCSFSIEPYYAYKMDRPYIDNDDVKHQFKLVSPLLEEDKYKKECFVTSIDVTPKQHVKMQAIFQKYIDSAISKTIILPHDYTLEQTKEIYMQAYDLSCKGLTVYRDMSKKDQVYTVSAEDDNKDSITTGKVDLEKASIEKLSTVEIPSTNITVPVKKRPKKLPGYTYKCKIPGGNFYITVTYNDSTAFEVFATANIDDPNNPQRANEASVNTEALTRIISLALRSGIKPEKLAEQLNRVKNQSMLSMPHQLANILKEASISLESHPVTENPMLAFLPVGRKCKSCGKGNLVPIEGCLSCDECGWSKCE